MKSADKADRECRWALSLSPEIFLTLHRCVCFWQVGCMPWLWGSANTNSSIIIIDVDSGANHTMAELPCDGARYAFLSCVVGTLTLALFLRISWMPKMALMLLLGVLYLTVLELSGFRKTAGWEVHATTYSESSDTFLTFPEVIWQQWSERSRTVVMHHALCASVGYQR